MSDKAIIVTDIPESCSKCKFMYEFYGVKKCQLLNVLKNGGKAIICVDKLNVARKECCPMVSSEEYDKEIRNKAIEEFTEKLKEKCNSMIAEKWNNEVAPISWANAYADFKDDVDELAEQMKGVGE